MDKNFLKELLEIGSPSGYEKKAAELWVGRAKKFCDMTKIDIHGNGIAGITNVLNERPSSIMLAGHIDEIGLIISHIDKEIIYFQTIGGWDPQIFPGQRVRIHTKTNETIKGCIGRKPIHSLSEKEKTQAVKKEDLWIDVGNKERAKKVSVGDYAVIDYGAEFWNNILVARGIDDRVDTFIILEALLKMKKDKLEKAVYAVATVQEEIGLRGAITSAYSINPSIGLAVDVTFASDYPGANKKNGDIRLGEGPVIAIGPNITPSIHEALVATAKKNKIPYRPILKLLKLNFHNFYSRTKSLIFSEFCCLSFNHSIVFLLYCSSPPKKSNKNFRWVNEGKFFLPT